MIILEFKVPSPKDIYNEAKKKLNEQKKKKKTKEKGPIAVPV
ncbi:hypothetical protein [Ligilactobacillus acidipiscis]|jgi:hypothetical protein|uniref:Uncharacterized protein n=1 Tax=Ligilactobacillus acidipiscis TaxID=89059 RepID=A0A1K1KLM4_9LACO|nr:hypothetical protein [Ligilactobacillus acidipiscis]WEV57295.1 hypothetical protein OZX66_01765 [Ligilactobacillus acidipiscis]GEN20199.1 hypothetical protein LAC02_34800 [Ligilactobacillus acidipiscis]SFV39784.1 hypothetical protein LAC1533_0364 [Ligilactobacillus acidipiscis]